VADPRRGSRHRIPRLALAAALAGVVITLLVPFAPAASARPTNPSNSSINRAKAAQAQAARDVGRLSGLISQIEARLQRLNDRADLAKQKYDKALWDLDQAKKAAAKARRVVSQAQQNLDAAQKTFHQFLRAVYTNSDIGGSSLLTASDPNVLLSRGDLTNYTSAHQINGIGTLTRAKLAKSNADAAARNAVIGQKKATVAAGVALKAAVDAVNAAKVQRTALLQQKAAYQAQLQRAGMILTGLQNKRAAYLKWRAQQEALRRAAAARRAAALRRALASSGGVSVNPNPSGSAAPIGVWTPAKGRAAVGYAERYLGWPYAWDGGTYYGPSRGLCIDAVTKAFGDCHKIGFDCSGLTMYAWAQLGIYTQHYAPSQWSIGRFHPSISQLMPGDLILYSSNGNPYSAHHVTMYIGDGKMIEAPQSGEYVHITWLRLDEFAGAVRPGS
jgi:cell wall-associated NlpC family hydrolase